MAELPDFGCVCEIWKACPGEELGIFYFVLMMARKEKIE